MDTITYTSNESTRLARLFRKMDKTIQITYKTNNKRMI